MHAELTPIAHVAQTQMEVATPRAKLAPLSPGRFELRVTISKEAHDNLRYLQALASHSALGNDVEIGRASCRERVFKDV